MTYVVIALFFGLAGGVVGRVKGSSFLLWFLISAIVPVVGLLAAVAYRIERDEPLRLCPRCGKSCKAYDALCTRCGMELEFDERTETFLPETATVEAHRRQEA